MIPDSHKVLVTTTPQEMGLMAAIQVLIKIQKNNNKGTPTVLILPTGGTAEFLYEALVALAKKYNLDFRNVHTFNLDEYLGGDGLPLSADHPHSYKFFMNKHFFQPLRDALGGRAIPAEQTHFPSSFTPGDYDRAIAALGGADIVIGGIGVEGHFAFNEALTKEERETPLTEAEILAFFSSPTHIEDLSESTQTQNAHIVTDNFTHKLPPWDLKRP